MTPTNMHFRKKVCSIHWLASGSIGIARCWRDANNHFRSHFTIYPNPTNCTLIRLSNAVHRFSLERYFDSIMPAQPTEEHQGWLIFTTPTYYNPNPKGAHTSCPDSKAG
jgi:hypothetical protein